MRILKIDFPAEERYGLNAIKMHRLGQVVLIAGKNGSGKTRLLNLIKEKFRSYPKNSIKSFRKSIEEEIETLRDNVLLNDSNKITYEKTLNKKFRVLNQIKEITFSSDEIKQEIIDFVPKKLELQDCMAFNKHQLTSNASSLNSNGIESASQCTISKIQFVQDRWYSALHPKSSMDDKSKQQSINDYTKLALYIKEFLGVDIGRDTEDDATLFNKKLGQANLSDGQKVLLQLCVSIFAQEGNLKEKIIFLDEPENHLHPEALIYFIDSLKSVVTDGQIWIATHSIHLLAHLDASSIWYIENGSVSYEGSAPERVLKGLIGGENEIAKLGEFLTLPAQMASVQFAFECLFPPVAVQTGADDPQTNQILEAIKELSNQKKTIKILDFGAGQGRLLAAINEIESSSGMPVSAWLDYIAYDIPSEYKDTCKKIITDVYGDVEDRYFDDDKNLLEKINNNTFDLIVMCNVFHEINPTEWLRLFSEHSLIRSCLKSDGHLLIVEDQFIPVGEKAYKNGFLVFDVIQFKLLFSLPNGYKFRSNKNDRLKAHFIPASSLANITSETRCEAIKNFKTISLQEVRKLREMNGSLKNGRLHAFWAQQAVNAQLVLDELAP